MADDTKSSKSEDHDVVLVHGRTEDGQGLRALRSRPGKLELAEIRKLKEGQPINTGEVVSLQPRQESPLLWDVDVQYRTGAEAALGAGPPKVTSQKYRSNWDSVFGSKRREPRRKKKLPDKASLN